MATDRTIAQLRTVVRSLQCDPRTFFTIVLRTHEKVAPQERQSLRPFLISIVLFLFFCLAVCDHNFSGVVSSR
jgi:hypothetical protein